MALWRRALLRCALILRFTSHPPQADLELWVEGDRFVPGDDVSGRITIASNKGFQVRRGLITLSCVETFWRKEEDSVKKVTDYLVNIRREFMSNGAASSTIGRTTTLEFRHAHTG